MREPEMGEAPATAAVLVIGDEILSGRTQDVNTQYIANYLAQIGVDLREVARRAGRRGRNRRGAKCAARPLFLCLHNRRHRADPRRHHRRRHRQGFRARDDRGPARHRHAARALHRGRADAPAPPHGANAQRRRARAQRPLQGAGILDRQCDRDGRRAGHHAVDDGRGRAAVARRGAGSGRDGRGGLDPGRKLRHAARRDRQSA